jgi:hypothetical protein
MQSSVVSYPAVFLFADSNAADTGTKKAGIVAFQIFIVQVNRQKIG